MTKDFVLLRKAIPPAWGAAGQRFGLEYAARDGPRQRVGGNAPKLGDLVDSVGERAAAGRGGEYGIAVERRVRRVDGAGQPVLCHDGKFPGLRLAQRRVGDDDGERRIFAW